jgi:hypothetical protein
MPVEFGKGVVLKDEGADETVVTAGLYSRMSFLPAMVLK